MPLSALSALGSPRPTRRRGARRRSHGSRRWASTERRRPFGLMNVQAQGRKAWDTPTTTADAVERVEPDHAQPTAWCTAPVPRLTPLGFHGHRSAPPYDERGVAHAPGDGVSGERSQDGGAKPMPSEPKGMDARRERPATGCGQSRSVPPPKRPQAPTRSHTPEPTPGRRRRRDHQRVGNPEACHPPSSHRRPQAGADAGTFPHAKHAAAHGAHSHAEFGQHRAENLAVIEKLRGDLAGAGGVGRVVGVDTIDRVDDLVHR